MSSLSVSIAADRESVLRDYDAAKAKNYRRFVKGDDQATAEYIFPNQIADANAIVDKLYRSGRRVISIQKKTKVGADGLMIEIAKLLTTHIDDSFVVNLDNVRILTGMSNAGWEKDMIEKAPDCFKDKIFHHGKLSRAELMSIRNGLIIIDEIDTGDKEYQVLHTTLKEAGILNVEHMKKYNNRFIFISATMIRELYELYKWGSLHELYTMTIPASYFGHKDFLERGIIQEFYSLDTAENAERWVQEDIIDNYGDDYRINIVRVSTKNVDVVQNACIRKGVTFRNHTSTDRLSQDEIKEFFKEPLNQHIVLGVKGFFRRANLIPNRWKMRIGATHERFTKVVDNNVQIQGLTGRMTGYWRSEIEGGHKTGPHRTSIKAIKEYEQVYLDPFGANSYKTAGFKKKKGKVIADPIMLSAKHIQHLEVVELPDVEDPTDPATVPIVFTVTPHEYESIKRVGRGGRWDYTTITPIIQKYRPEIVAELERIEQGGGRDQIVEPDVAATTYAVYITEFASAAAKGKRHKHVGNIEDKTLDTFQIYLDRVEHRIIVSIQYGSKTSTIQHS